MPVKVVRSVVGRVIHSGVSRQPVIPQVGTGLSAGFLPKVPATRIVNPLQRQPLPRQ